MASVGTVEVERVRPVVIERRPREKRSATRRVGRVGTGLLLLGTAALLGRASANRPLRALRARPGASDLAGRVAGNIGRGLVAGAFGTLAITIASGLDSLATEAYRARKKQQRASLSVRNVLNESASSTGGLVSKALGFVPNDSAHQRRVGTIAHWGYGTLWGISMPLLHAAGLSRFSAMTAVCTGQLTVEMLALPSLKLLPSPTKWGAKGIVSSVYQHAIYAFAAVKAYDWLKPCSAE